MALGLSLRSAAFHIEQLELTVYNTSIHRIMCEICATRFALQWLDGVDYLVCESKFEHLLTPNEPMETEHPAAEVVRWIRAYWGRLCKKAGGGGGGERGKRGGEVHLTGTCVCINEDTLADKTGSCFKLHSSFFPALGNFRFMFSLMILLNILFFFWELPALF